MAGRTDKFDWVTFALYISTLVIGWLMLYAVSFSELENGVFSFDSTIGKQTMWLGLALVVFLLCQIIDSRFWKTVAIPIYGFSIILLIAVLIFGVELKGARSWFSIFGLSFQPSEIAKFATILALASYLDHYETRLRNYKAQLVSVGLIALPAGLILLQPDAGSALSFSALMILLYREGMPGTYFASAFFLAAMLIAGFILPMPIVILAIFCLASFVIWTSLGKGKSRINFGVPILLLLLNSYHLLYNDIGNPIYLINGVAITYLLYMAWNNRQQQILWTVPTLIFLGALTAWFSNYAFNNVLEIHQQDRINVWLQPDKCDPQGALYNIIQSKVAIGSGGFMGKGFLGGTMTKLNYVPEQATDFIFTTIGEEQGFLGSVGVIIIFFAMIMRIVYLGEKKQNSFIRNYGYGLAGLLFFHVFINIGMTMGLVPIIGIPLPFVSKGGTALLSFSIILSVYLKLLASRR